MINQFTEILSALLTPTIACVTTYIAWQQWKINKLKVNLLCYDRRLRIYDAVREILAVGAAGGENLTDERLRMFHINVSEADFLFDDPKIRSYLEEIYTHGDQLQYLNKKTDPKSNLPDGPNRDELFDNLEKEIHWFGAQFEPAKEKFRKYLNIGSA